jgi:hypothetical protein
LVSKQPPPPLLLLRGDDDGVDKSELNLFAGRHLRLAEIAAMHRGRSVISAAVARILQIQMLPSSGRVCCTEFDCHKRRSYWLLSRMLALFVCAFARGPESRFAHDEKK